MSFIQRELDRIGVALREPRSSDDYCQFYAVQQALLWALDPVGCFKSPYDMILSVNGTPEDSKDYPEGSGHSQFSDTRDCHVS